MKILVLQSSPRAKGSTVWMADEYKKAAEAAGHEVTLVDVAKKKIAGCLACEYCHGKGEGACVQKDDMQELYPLLAEAEVIVIATPIYYFTFNSQMQAAIHRCYNMMTLPKVKKLALLLSSYSPGVYDAAIAQYRYLCGYWKAAEAGIVTASYEEQKTDATRQKILDIVGQL